MFIVVTNCGSFDVGDELELPNNLYRDEQAARAEYLERLEKCRCHVIGQANIVNREPSLIWADSYRYWNVLLEIPNEWEEPDDDADDILGRRIDKMDGSFIRAVEYGVCNEQGLKQEPSEIACHKVLEQLSYYGTYG